MPADPVAGTAPADAATGTAPADAVAGTAHPPVRASAIAVALTESVIREMTRLALEYDAINLAQGFPDFPAPEAVKHAATAAIEADINQYPITWGQPSIRQALAEKYRRWYGMDVDPNARSA